MADFVCIGDASQDNFFFIDEEIKYGGKIPVQKYGVSCGGNAANVATGLSRLGVKTELVTVFGEDRQGSWLKKKLLENGVGLESCVTEEGRQSNTSAVIVFKNERTILTYHAAGKKVVEKIPETGWIYLTAAREYGQILAQKGAAKLAFNPAAEDLRQGKEFLQEVVDQTDVLLVNKEEWQILGNGPKITAVTDGPNGADAFVDGQKWHCDAFPAQVLETTGAGDAFASGFLAGLYFGKNIEESMKWGMANSAAVISKVGAQDGLLTKERLLEKI